MDARLSDKVLSNQDLVRHLLSQSSDATGLLSISKAVRDGEPCSRQYERWSFQGCPSDGGECLRAIGGLDSTFCQGTYDLTVLHRIWPSRREDPAREVATRVVDLLGRRPLSGELVITLTLGSTTLRIRVGRENVISLIDRGWRKRGVVCKPTDAQVRQLLRTVLTRTGKIPLPCPPNSQSRGPITVPRSIHIRVAVWDQEEEWLLLYGQRR